VYVSATGCLNIILSWYEGCSIKFDEKKTQVIYFSRKIRIPDDVLQLNGRDIPFVNNVTYLGVTFGRRMPWRHHTERTVAKALAYVRKDLFRSGRLITNIKLTFYRALIMSDMTYTCPTSEHAADAHLLKLQRLQNRIFRATRKLDRYILVR
jgi:hypothetical protein